MERVQWIEHKGKKILYMNLSDVAPNDYDLVVQTVQKTRAAIDREPAQSVHLMTDLSSSRYDARFVEIAKDFMRKNKQNVFASAIVGARALVVTAIYAMNALTGRQVKCFDDIEKAKEWLSQF